MELGIEPIEISYRDKLGKILALDELDNLGRVAKEMHSEADSWEADITKLSEQTVFNIGNSGEAAADYLIGSLN